MSLRWNKSFALKEESSNFKIDSIISGIVLAGVLGLYFLFIYLQINRVMSGLPQQFTDVESWVKSGFWQLFFLSILNVVAFLFYIIELILWCRDYYFCLEFLLYYY